MSPFVLLEWKFSPPDYFEEEIEISRQDYTISIADKQVQSKIDSVFHLIRSSWKKWHQRPKMDKMVMSGGLAIHLQKSPKLSKEWRERHFFLRSS